MIALYLGMILEILALATYLGLRRSLRIVLGKRLRDRLFQRHDLGFRTLLSLFRYGSRSHYEPEIEWLIFRILKKSRGFVDAGAGYYVSVALRTMRGGTVVALEPEKANFSQLREREGGRFTQVAT